MRLSYIGSAFHEFWSRCGKDAKQHPDDALFLKELQNLRGRYKRPATFEFQFPPSPFDGPLEHARLVICLANPRYTGLQGDISTIILRQRHGTAPLPPEWDDWYGPRIAKRLGSSMDELRTKVAVLNVCPYASERMDGPETSLAAGLPSVWAAQRHLRDVLIPRARNGGLQLVFLRKHELWGITEGWVCDHIHVVRGHELGGTIPDDLAQPLHGWLQEESQETNQTRCESEAPENSPSF